MYLQLMNLYFLFIMFQGVVGPIGRQGPKGVEGTVVSHFQYITFDNSCQTSSF